MLHRLRGAKTGQYAMFAATRIMQSVVHRLRDKMLLLCCHLSSMCLPRIPRRYPGSGSCRDLIFVGKLLECLLAFNVICDNLRFAPAKTAIKTASTIIAFIPLDAAPQTIVDHICRTTKKAFFKYIGNTRCKYMNVSSLQRFHHPKCLIALFFWPTRTRFAVCQTPIVTGGLPGVEMREASVKQGRLPHSPPCLKDSYAISIFTTTFLTETGVAAQSCGIWPSWGK